MPLLKSSNGSFMFECFRKLNWTALETAIDEKDDSRYVENVEKVMNVAFKFLMVDPTVAINDKCLPPPISYDCESKGLTTRPTPVKLAHMIQLGFDVDTLEIHLHEIHDTVDKIFIIESTASHFKGLSKPLVWGLLSQNPRFEKFKNKIVHFVIDDAEAIEVVARDKGIWAMEAYTESARYARFVKWNAETQFFTDDDVLGFGDADEISSRSTALHLKHCEFKTPSIDAGIIFIEGFLTTRFRTDWPVPGHPYRLGDPSFFTVKTAREHKNPSRQRGRSGSFITGGLHLTHYGYMPFQILKQITCTECGFRDAATVKRYHHFMDSEDHLAVEAMIAKTGQRVIEDAVPGVEDMPWFLACNADRFPRWYGKHDARLDLTERDVDFTC